MPAPEPLRYAHFMRIDPYSILARFTEAIVRSRPGKLEVVRFEHATAPDAASGNPRLVDGGPHG